MEKPRQDLIRMGGHRLTRQRRLILEILETSQEHLDAETLYIRAKARDPRIGLATVYRSLALLKAMGLVEEQRLGEDHGHFETIRKSPHYHFTCKGCGLVVELEAQRVTEAVRRLSAGAGLQVVDISLHLGGYCANCQAARVLGKEPPADG